MKPAMLMVVLIAVLMTFVEPLSAEESSEGPGLMKVVSLDQWQGVLQAQQPNIVVADLWASWCVSCIERFPKMVELATRFNGRDIKFLTLNLDDPQDQSGIDWSNEFLAGLGGDFGHYHLAENLTVSFEALDLMSLPVVLIYDGDGSETYRLTNDNPNRQFTEADIETALQALPGEKARQ